MRGASPELYDLARWLLAHEAADLSGPDGVAEAAEAACRKLRRPLVVLLGTGFDVLVLRALDMASSQFPFMKEIKLGLGDEGCLTGVKEAAKGQDPSQIADGLATQLAQFLWLLVTFIGEDLAMREVARVWPEAPLGEPGTDVREARE